MNTTEIKSNLHQLIESIDDNVVLTKFYDLILTAKNNTGGSLWNTLSQEERDELLLFDMEADNPDNLVSHEEVRAKHQKWL